MCAFFRSILGIPLPDVSTTERASSFSWKIRQ